MRAPEPEQAQKPHQDKAERFVEAVIKRCQEDKGYAAKLKRSDNPATEYQSWEILSSFGIDLEKDYQRLPYVTVAAAIAKARTKNNGSHTFGNAIARCYEKGKESDQARAKLRRVLACHNLPEVSRVLRPVFSLINSRSVQPLNFTRILKQLLRFYWNQQSVKAQWAQEFYAGKTGEKGEES